MKQGSSNEGMMISILGKVSFASRLKGIIFSFLQKCMCVRVNHIKISKNLTKYEI